MLDYPDFAAVSAFQPFLEGPMKIKTLF